MIDDTQPILAYESGDASMPSVRLPRAELAALLGLPAVIITGLLLWSWLAVRHFQQIVGDMPICYSQLNDHYAGWAIVFPALFMAGLQIAAYLAVLRSLRRKGFDARTVLLGSTSAVLLIVIPIVFIVAWIIVGDIYYFSDIFY